MSKHGQSEQTSHRTELYIGGEWRESSRSESIDVTNPATGEQIASVESGTREDARAAVKAANEARERWETIGPQKRADYLFALDETFRDEQEAFRYLLVTESGSTHAKVDRTLDLVSDIIRDAAGHVRDREGSSWPADETDRFSVSIRQPKGVASIITPWNFPLLLSAKKSVYSLANGNTVVLKPSSETPIVGGLKLGELFDTADFPAGVMNVVTGPGSEVGDEFISNECTNYISFTGSTEVGRRVATKAGENLTETTLELGGKDPLVVFNDFDIQQAVDIAKFSSLFHQGQNCMSTERVIVEESIADEFTERLTNDVEELTMGDPADRDIDLGPMINQEQLQQVSEQVSDAVESGATLHTGGDYEDLFFQPTVLSDVTTSMKVWEEETFGPTIPIVTFDDNEDSAVKLANDSQYGLAAAVLTNDQGRAIDVARRIEAGMVHINDVSGHDGPFVPFGGVKDSGLGGREGGKHSAHEVTDMKWMSFLTEPADYAF